MIYFNVNLITIYITVNTTVDNNKKSNFVFVGQTYILRLLLLFTVSGLFPKSICKCKIAIIPSQICSWIIIIVLIYVGLTWQMFQNYTLKQTWKLKFLWQSYDCNCYVLQHISCYLVLACNNLNDKLFLTLTIKNLNPNVTAIWGLFL